MKKAPGKYDVLGGRRTTRFSFREPVVGLANQRILAIGKTSSCQLTKTIQLADVDKICLNLVDPSENRRNRNQRSR